ncbi:MAG: hypothetical protein AAF333_07260 [Planctomycetota bacterium]
MPDTPGPDLTVYRRLLIFGGSRRLDDPPKQNRNDMFARVFDLEGRGVYD